jgi:hypothetical protein
MRKLKCDWDCCKHYNMETGYCDNPDEVELVTVEATTGSLKKELFDCKGFVYYEEGEAKS